MAVDMEEAAAGAAFFPLEDLEPEAGEEVEEAAGRSWSTDRQGSRLRLAARSASCQERNCQIG